MAETPAGMLLRERDEARALLGDGYSRDEIDDAELERRLELVEHAGSIAELRALTVDVRPVASAALVPVSQVPASERLPVLFASLERRGAWQVAPHTVVRVRFGSAMLDLREAQLPDGDVELSVSVVFGSLEIVVPPGWRVDNRCRGVFSSVDHQPGVGATGEARVLRVTGHAVFGSVEILERPHGSGPGRHKALPGGR